MKKALLIVLLLNILLGVSGCMGKSAYEQMESYMEEKYGENFTFQEATGSNRISGSSYRSANFSSEKFPDGGIHVNRYTDDNGKYRCSDNYAAYLLKDEATEFLTDLAKPIYKDCKVCFHHNEVFSLPTEYGKDTSVKQLLVGGQMFISIFLNSNANLLRKDEDIDQFRIKLKENGIFAEIIVWYLTVDNLDDINMTSYDYNSFSLEEDKGKLYKEVGLFNLDENFEFSNSNLRWR